LTIHCWPARFSEQIKVIWPKCHGSADGFVIPHGAAQTTALASESTEEVPAAEDDDD
jgi:hypothetical protein